MRIEMVDTPTEEKIEMDQEEMLGPGSAGYDGAEKRAQPHRFRIDWHGFHYGYRVSIPNYEGGEVVKAGAYDALREAATEAINVLKMEFPGSLKRKAAIAKLRAALALVDGNKETK